MDLSLASNPEILMLVLGVVVAACVAGLLAGFLGVGGGIVLVPVLFWLFGLTNFPQDLLMHMAVATSLTTIAFTSISSMRAHHKKGGVDMALLRKWAPFLALGALSGGLVSRYVDASALKLVFGCVGLLVAVNFTLPKPIVLSPQLPVARATNAAISYVIGLISSLMGIGGGTLSVPVLSMFSVPIRTAVGTASAFGLIIALPAVLGFMIAGAGIPNRPPFSVGYVNFIAVICIIPFTILLAPVGAKLAHSIEPVLVKRSFAFFLAITALRMLWSLA